jgi:protein tyrosine/serine phosphatase
MKPILRRLALAGAIAAGSVIAVAAGIYGVVQHDDNLHELTPGVYYRSAQMSGAALRDTIQREHIRTVLNLRGPNTGKPWYDDEIAAARGEGVNHLDIALSARQELSVAQMDELVRVVRDAPKPLLVHCNGGSDRTGLVSALYELSRGESVETAQGQLALRYGHFPHLGVKSIAMDRSLAAYVAARAASGASSVTR